MHDTKSFAKALKSVVTTIAGTHEKLQDLAIFAIHQVYNNNMNQVNDLLMALTKETKTKGERTYISADAGRVMQFISDFAPVIVQPVVGVVKKSATREAKGMTERDETGYPKWYDWAKASTPAVIKEQDGASIILASIHSVMKAVKEGKKKITPETQDMYERLIGGINDLITSEIKTLQAVVVAEKEQEQNQKAAAKPAGKKHQPLVVAD
jgi:hypothetical protein